MKKQSGVQFLPLIIGYLLFFSGFLSAQSIVKDFITGPDGSGVAQLTALNNGLVLFAANDLEHGNELWITDGACTGTRFIQDIRSGVEGSFPGGFTQVGNLVFFEADDGLHGRELWAYNIAQDTAYLVLDVFDGPGSFGIWEMFNCGDTLLLFTPEDDVYGRELWRSDGTTAGTYLLKDLQAGPAGSAPGPFVYYNGWVYFGAFDSSHGPSLWRTDGTVIGTKFIHDFNPSGIGGHVYAMFNFKGKLVVVADHVTFGRELWTSTGEPGTFSLLKDLNPGSNNGLSDHEYVQAGNYIYFGGSDGVHGSELWRTDGTADGTILVADIRPGALSSVVDRLVANDTLLFFEADDGIHGEELWFSRIFNLETALVADIRPGSGSSFPANLIFVGDSLYFTANDVVHGFELWNCDLATRTAHLVADMQPGPVNSSYISFLDFNDTLLFSAWSAQWGTELFRYPPAAVSGAALSVQVASIQHVACKGLHNGRIEVTVLQGPCPYSYLWSNGGQKEYIDHLSGGVYSCTVTAADGQQVVLGNLVVNEPTQLTATQLEAVAPDCLGNLGYATAGAQGGTPPYNFVWENGATGPSISNIPAPGAWFTVTVTDANGCTTFAYANAVTEQPPAAQWYLLAPPAVCPDGIAAITQFIPNRSEAKGAQLSTNSYHWTAFAGGAIVGNPDTPYTLIQGAGLYVLETTVISNGCSRVDSFWVETVAMPPTVYAGDDQSIPCSQTIVSLQGSVENPENFGDPTWYWQAFDGGAVLGFPSDLFVEVLGVGTYVLNYENIATGCRDADTMVVSSLHFTPEASSAGGNLTCLSDTAVLSVTIQSPMAVFEGWYGPNGFFSPNQTVTVIETGDYYGTVTDTISGCTTEVHETVYLNNYPPQLYSLYADLLYCPGEQPVTIYSSTYPSSGLAYSWTGPDNFVSNLEYPQVSLVGEYFVTITNPDNGCTNYASINVFSGEPLEIETESTQSPDCSNGNNGAAFLTAYGGTGIYNWRWPDGTKKSFNENLAAGQYVVTLTDASGCTETVVINIDAPSPLIWGIQSLTPVDCAGNSTGAATLEASGGTEPYSWLWPDGTTEPTNEDLAAGEYVVTLTDASGCTSEVVINIDAPSPLIWAAFVTPADCAGNSTGAATLEASGGTEPYSWLWPDGTTEPANEGLAAGEYVVTLTDGNGCTGEVVINIDAPSPLLLGTVVVVDDQNSQGIGAIYAHIEGGTPPYEYGWTLNGQPVPGTNDSLIQLFTGNYVLLVTDANGCAFSTPPIFVNNLIAALEPLWAAGLILAPNPTDDQVQIRFSTPLPGTPLVRIFDETGRVASSALLREEATVIWLGTTALSPGMYQVQVVVGRERVVRKLVVVR